MSARSIMEGVNIFVWIPSMDTVACATKDTSWYHCLLTVKVRPSEVPDDITDVRYMGAREEWGGGAAEKIRPLPILLLENSKKIQMKTFFSLCGAIFYM